MDFLPLDTSLQQFFLSEEFLRILIALVIAIAAYLVFTFFVRYWIGTMLRQIVSRAKASLSRERQINAWIVLIERLGGIVIALILILTILSDLKYNIAPLLTGAGILGLAIGLGSQNLMKDIVGGVFIFLEGNYTEGDKVKIGGVAGRVEKMTLRRTYLRSEKNQSLHIIPNGEVKIISVLSSGPVLKKAGGVAKEKKYAK
ncbi:MAG: mechanosensitive ion channel [Candidatus Moranbacteria bacterium]|nr:mechanosensitive ion channel [Candidatus Moranbacteria bacterium]